jgi:hypothetical protein
MNNIRDYWYPFHHFVFYFDAQLKSHQTFSTLFLLLLLMMTLVISNGDGDGDEDD